MMINTHIIIANYILDNIDEDKLSLINRRRFIWGNIKPDCASRYKFKKHYYAESIDMIVDKINKLSSLSVTQVNNESSIGKFSGELGIICHFLTDYYCLPHFERWEFKHAMRPHVFYEKELAKVSKTYNINIKNDTNSIIEDVREFIDENLELYSLEKGYINDLNFACYVCSSIFNLILDSVIANEETKVLAM